MCRMSETALFRSAFYAAFAYFILTALACGFTFFYCFYSASHSSGDSPGVGVIAVAALFMFILSLLGLKSVRVLAKAWRDSKAKNRAISAAAIALVFALPTGFPSWFSLYLMVS